MTAIRGEYDRTASGYDQRWAEYNAGSLALLRPLLGGRSLGQVLDLGCGTGNLLGALRSWGADLAGYVGLDPSTAMLARAREKERSGRGAGWVAGEAERLPLRDGSFDTLISASSLHFWTSPADGLHEAWRVLRPGGSLVLLDWCADHLPLRLLDGWLRLRGRSAGAWTMHRMRREVEAAGFTVTSQRRSRISALWDLMLCDAARPTPP